MRSTMLLLLIFAAGCNPAYYSRYPGLAEAVDECDAGFGWTYFDSCAWAAYVIAREGEKERAEPYAAAARAVVASSCEADELRVSTARLTMSGDDMTNLEICENHASILDTYGIDVSPQWEAFFEVAGELCRAGDAKACLVAERNIAKDSKQAFDPMAAIDVLAKKCLEPSIWDCRTFFELTETGSTGLVARQEEVLRNLGDACGPDNTDACYVAIQWAHAFGTAEFAARADEFERRYFPDNESTDSTPAPIFSIDETAPSYDDEEEPDPDELNVSPEVRATLDAIDAQIYEIDRLIGFQQGLLGEFSGDRSNGFRTNDPNDPAQDVWVPGTLNASAEIRTTNARAEIARLEKERAKLVEQWETIANAPAQ